MSYAKKKTDWFDIANTAVMVAVPLAILGAIVFWMASPSSEREDISLFNFQMRERIVPFLEVDSPSIEPNFDKVYGVTPRSGRFVGLLRNNSAYPVTKVDIVCDVNYDTGRSETGYLLPLRDYDVLMPGEAVEVQGTTISGGFVPAIGVENIYCEVTGAEHPFSYYKGIPEEFSHLDWKRGAAAFTRTK